MKNYLKGIAFGLLAAVVIASAPLAQTYQKSGANSNGNFNVKAATITSATVLGTGSVFDTSAPLYVTVAGTAAGSVLLTPVLADGTPGAAVAQTVTVGTVTPTIVSFSAPLPFSGIRISPTATLSGANSVSVKLIQSK